MIIFVNGTFDLLHRGHLEMLNYAKSLGDYLAVGIDTDDRVKEKKGDLRPIHNESDRKFFLKNLSCVDIVYTFSSDDELEILIKTLKPDIMVVGSDWKGKNVIGSQFAKRLVFFERIEKYASSKIIQNIVNRG